MSRLRWATSRALRPVPVGFMVVSLLLVPGCGDAGTSVDDDLVEANAVCADAVDHMDAVTAPVFASYLPTISDDPTDQELIGPVRAVPRARDRSAKRSSDNGHPRTRVGTTIRR